MHVLTRALIVALFWWSVADSPVVAAKEKPSTTSVIKTLREGDHCCIGTDERIAWNRRATCWFCGTVKSRSEDAITFTNVATTGRMERSLPITIRIPYVNRMFKNVGIGRSHLAEQDVVVRVKEISSVQVIDEDEFETIIARAKDNHFHRVGTEFP